MNIYALIIVNVIYYLLGRDMYKKLKSYPNLKDTIITLAKTLERLDKVKTDDESVVPGRNELLTQYKFFKSNLYNILSYKYVILNENFKDVAINEDSFRLIPLEIQPNFIGKFIVYKFNLASLDIKDDKLDFDDKTKVMTALQWNSFWEDIVRDCKEEKSLENLSSQYLLLSQIPGVVTENESINYSESISEVEIGKFFNFRNDTELKQEFALICCHSEEMSKLSPSKIELTGDYISDNFDIHSYLFNGI